MSRFTFELDPPPGLNSDDSTFALQGRWATGHNIRFHNGRAETIRGFEHVFSFSFGPAARAILALDRGGTITLAYGLASTGYVPKLFVGTGLAAPTEVTPAGLTSGHVHWSLAAWGSTLLAAPGRGVGLGAVPPGTLYEQTGSSQATAVAAAPDNISRMLVTLQRQVLALGCNEETSGIFNERCIRGSDIEDYTDWTSSSTNNAFEHILDGAGRIVSGVLLGDYVVIWTESALYLGSYIGSPGQTYRFDKVADNCGIIGPQAYAILNERLFWIGTDLLPRTYIIGSLPEIISFPLVDVFRPYSSTDRIVGASFSRFEEVRFYYTEVGSENDRFISLSITDGAWSAGRVGRSASHEMG